MRFEYALTEQDVADGVALMLAPSPASLALRARLMPAIRGLLVVLLALIAYIEIHFWRRLARTGMPVRFVPLDTLALICVLPFAWLALELLVRKLARDPEFILRWARERTTRRLLASAAPGPRSLVLTEKAVEVAGRVRPWKTIRRLRLNERHLVLACAGLWIMVPLHALTEEKRAALRAEVEKRSPVRPS